MFTGIIKHNGIVVSNVINSDGRILSILIPNLKNQEIGNSIAIMGCCLTITAINNDIYSFYVSSETLKQTTLAMFLKGQDVNIEPAMLASTPLGGHIVLGHVDEVARIVSIEEMQSTRKVFVEISPKYKKDVIRKGSITIDGISLTVMNILKNVVELNVIPHTWENTTLHLLNSSTANLVNVEFDQMAKVIRKQIENHFANV